MGLQCECLCTQQYRLSCTRVGCSLLTVYATLIAQDLRREAVGRSVLRAGDRVGASRAGGVPKHTVPGLSRDYLLSAGRKPGHVRRL